ncbi:auxin efflux carrier component 5 [Sesamum indicum]|uniref:Auxin efflux carrier component n=1 Tax=Sesamum indicum TaxID=4182 RepID=A0A6I9T511_SESIN|nr:auxin efflux carrier component 5 [Sesamum indicum]
MIGWEDVYKVLVGIAPLYVALILGYCSVKWWRMFTPDQCEAINRLVCYFTYPLFVFEFTASVDPFKMNYLFMAADAISKLIIVTALACWAKCSSKGSYCWSITSFSLSTLTSSLVVGVPLLKSMYGPMAVDLVVQSSVFQALVWLSILLFVLELRRTRNQLHCFDDDDHHHDNNIIIIHDQTTDVHVVAAATTTTTDEGNNLENQLSNDINNNNICDSKSTTSTSSNRQPSFWSLMKRVWLKLAKNPNSYACIIGIAWAFLSNRWNFKMPNIMEGSILIMSRAGTGTAMFSMGLFMALQEKVIACGASLTVFGMALRFIAGPLAMALGSVAVGLHGDVLRVAIIQAALPQSITSFIFAKEYGLHAEVLSTAVIFGMIVSLPVLIGYYALLEFVH